MWPHSNYCVAAPVEVELAFILGKPLKGPGESCSTRLSVTRGDEYVDTHLPRWISSIGGGGELGIGSSSRLEPSPALF